MVYITIVVLWVIVGGLVIYNFEKRSRDPYNLPYPYSG